jgi:hypothetical protein
LFVALFGSVVATCVFGPGASAVSRSLTVEPATDLKNQVVRVKWTGFDPTVDGAFTVTIYQCKGTPKSLADCYQPIRPPSGGDPLGTGIQDGVTLPDGTGSALLEVRPAFDLPVLDCTASNPCAVVAFENDGNPFPENGLPVTAVTAPLTFAPSPSDCPKVSTFDVVTGGEASAAEAMYGWSAKECTAKPALSIDYTESSSPAGRRDFLAGNLDLGITSMPADPATEPSDRVYTYAPLDVSGVAIAFNVTDTQTLAPIREMTLTPRLVALLIAGMQPTGPGTHLFQDAEFLALNPGHSWPENTQPPLLRAERNADAYLLTRWLQEDNAARAFLDGNDPTAIVDDYWKGITYPTDIFEARDPNTIGNYNPRQSTVANARRLFNFQAPGDGATISPLIDGVMGVLDVVTAKKFGLPMAKLVPAKGAGAPGVLPDAAGLSAGYKAMVPTSANAATKQADVQATNGAYPLVKIDYAMVPTSGISTEKAGRLARFLEYAAGAGQKPDDLPPGYLPLPSDLQAQSSATRAAVLAAPNATSTDGGATPPVGDVPTDTSFNAESVATSLGDYGLSGADFSSAGVGTDEYTSETRAPADAAGTSSGDGSHPRKRSGAEPLNVRFLGSEGHLVLPILLVLGLAALIAGPTMMVLLRRQTKVAGAGAAPGDEASP